MSARTRPNQELYRARVDTRGLAVSARLRDRAGAAAERASDAARVQIRELHTPADMDEACRLIDGIWRPDPTNPLMTTEMLLVLAHSGGYVVGAYDGDRLTGACFGLLATNGLHSHIAGVEERSRGLDVGYALKVHQRAWCLARGITTVTWTFDPLVGRNAYFNLAKLGAVPTEYLPDFYGSRTDDLNRGSASDRLLATWDLTAERVALACEGVPHVAEDDPPTGAGAAWAGDRSVVVGLDPGPDGRPALGRLDADVVLVRVPRDIEALRRTDPEAAHAWRPVVREVLGGLMAQGRVVRGFGRRGWYVVGRRLESS